MIIITLDEFPNLLPNLRIISTHGLGRGGGEKVAIKIKNHYYIKNRVVNLISSGNISFIKNILKLRGSKATELLLTAGIRDLPLALWAFFVRVPFAVYIQVPYKSSITYKDPIHYILVFLMFFFYNNYAKKIYVNSSNSLVNFNFGEVVLPINKIELDIALKKVDYHYSNKLENEGKLILTTVSRLYPERGKGSRDIDAYKSLVTECKNYYKSSGVKIVIEHYGDVHNNIFNKLNDQNTHIIFKGYDDNWILKSSNILVFFSKYEGFGLAAFEAYINGFEVFVNQAFPNELLYICKGMKKIDTSTNKKILKQILK